MATAATGPASRPISGCPDNSPAAETLPQCLDPRQRLWRRGGPARGATGGTGAAALPMRRQRQAAIVQLVRSAGHCQRCRAARTRVSSGCGQRRWLWWNRRTAESGFGKPADRRAATSNLTSFDPRTNRGAIVAALESAKGLPAAAASAANGTGGTLPCGQILAAVSRCPGRSAERSRRASASSAFWPVASRRFGGRIGGAGGIGNRWPMPSSKIDGGSISKGRTQFLGLRGWRKFRSSAGQTSPAARGSEATRWIPHPSMAEPCRPNCLGWAAQAGRTGGANGSGTGNGGNANRRQQPDRESTTAPSMPFVADVPCL